MSVDLPVLQSLVDIGGTYDAPAHHISFSGVTFTGTSWLGPSSNQGFADQQTGAYISGPSAAPSNALTACQSGCQQFESTRPTWSQMPAAVQVSAADTITFSGDQFVNLGQTALGIGNDANAHASGVGLGASSVTVTGSVFTHGSAGAVVVGGVRAVAHHPSDTRMTNRNITVSNNSIHDMGVDYRGITSILATYVTNATVAHNEIYNLPYSGLSIGYGWGANDAGGSNDYANRGLYNYQPRYTTATTASNNQVTGNYVHDIMQQMNDGGCIYTLSANPGGLISGNYCLRTNGYFGLYFDEGSRYFTATNNVFSAIGTWAVANYCCNNNTGTLTVTNNWTTNGATGVLNGDHGNTVSSNTTVTNGNWPSAAQSIISNAGIQPSGGGAAGVLRGVGSSRCLDVPNGAQTDGTFVDIWDCNGGAGQQWTLTSSNQLTVYGSKCLDVPGHATAAGTRVEIWSCNGGANQQWRLNADGTVVGIESGLCLDVTGRGTANGTAVEIWTCNGGSNQKWTRS